MNDPHVSALYYKVVLGNDVDYKNAPPLFETTEEFEFSIDREDAVFKMKQHYATEYEARLVVEEYLKTWDILIGLEHNPDDLKLIFCHSDIIDRSPHINNEKVVSLQVHALNHVHFTGNVSLHVSRCNYPTFPNNFRSSIDVETMYLRYNAYRKGREPLTSMAYVCLTILEIGANGRRGAAEQYNIEYDILDKLGKLVSTRGGPAEARKFSKNGIFNPLNPNERQWIELVIKAIIRRTGEYAYNPKRSFNQITLKDFPALI